MMLYMVLMMPLGTIYFSLFVILISLALSFFAMPVMGLVFELPVMILGKDLYYFPNELTIPSILAGIIFLTAIMHLAKGLGSMHGKMAKGLLVAE